MEKKSLVLLVLGFVLALALAPAIAQASSIEMEWKCKNAVINVLMHRYRPSSTSGWATEEFASLYHEAEETTGNIALRMDYSCDIEGSVSAVNGILEVGAFINQDYGAYFKGFRTSEIAISSPEFTVSFNVHTFAFKTHLDNTWIHGAWMAGEAKDPTIHALRFYQKTKSDGSPLGEYYALIDAVLSGDSEFSVVSDFFPDSRHDVWWGNETLAFDLLADDIDAYIDVEEFPIINVYMDVGHLLGEIDKPR